MKTIRAADLFCGAGGTSTGLASFFAGIGGFDLGFERAGFKTVCQAEWEPNCLKLLADKFSTAKQIPDVRMIAAVWRRMRLGKPIQNYETWKEIFELLANAAVFCGGFPCQDLSVAGARAGLAGERSGLWFAFRRIIALFRPAFVVIENVPGLLSSNGGGDLSVVLAGLEACGYRWAYRVLDAQYFGLAQRRRRVFVVGHSGGQWQRAAAVLFERESLSGNPAPSRETGKGVAGSLSARTQGGGGLGTDFEIGGGLSKSLRAQSNCKHREDSETYIPTITPPPPITASMSKGKNGQDAQGFIPVVAAHGQGGAEIMSNKSPTLNCNHEAPILFMSEGDLYKCGECAHSVNLKEHATTCPNCGSDTLENVMIEPSIGPNAGKRFDFGAQAYVFKPSHYTRGKDGAPSEVAPPFSADADKGDQEPVVFQPEPLTLAVRRLTPRECERLQGFPDDYTLIQHNGKPAADGPRYKALGNSMAVPVVRWIGERIQMVDEL